MLTSYLELIFDVLQVVSGNRYGDGSNKRLVNLAVMASFSIYKLITSSGKQLEETSLAHIVSLMYKLLTSSRGSDDLSIGFDRIRDRRNRHFTSNKTQKGKFHLINYLKDIVGFAEHQETATYGLGYKLTLTRNTDNADRNKDNATPLVKLKLTVLNGMYHITHLVLKNLII